MDATYLHRITGLLNINLLTLRGKLNDNAPGWDINENVDFLYDVFIGEQDQGDFSLEEADCFVRGLYGYDDEEYFGYQYFKRR